MPLTEAEAELEPETEVKAWPAGDKQRGSLISFEDDSTAQLAVATESEAAAASSSFTTAVKADPELQAAEKHKEALALAKGADNVFDAAFWVETKATTTVDTQTACFPASGEQSGPSKDLSEHAITRAALPMPAETQLEQSSLIDDRFESVARTELPSSLIAQSSSSQLLEYQARIAALEQENAQLAEKLMRLELERIELRRMSLQRGSVVTRSPAIRHGCHCNGFDPSKTSSGFSRKPCAGAILMYCWRYLEEQDALPQLAALHKYQQDARSEALLMIKCAYRMTEPAQRLQALQDASVFLGRASCAGLEFEWEAIKQDMDLLQIQAKMEEFDTRMEASAQEPMFQQHRRPSLKFATVRDALYYCFFFYPYAPENKLSQANIIREQLLVSDQMYTWMQLLARAQLQDWDSVASIPTLKGMIYKKAMTPIGFGPFVEVMTWFNGPMELRVRFAESITDPERKYLTCSRHRLHQPAIQALLALESKETLLRYRVQILGENALEQDIQTIDDAIADPRRKWKSRSVIHSKWRPSL
eukprot:jgi/Chlat1/6227/Chrsp44S05814